MTLLQKIKPMKIVKTIIKKILKIILVIILFIIFIVICVAVGWWGAVGYVAVIFLLYAIKFTRLKIKESENKQNSKN